MTPTRSAVGWLLLLITVFVGLGRLRFDTDVLNLLPQDLPLVDGLRTYQRHFAERPELIVTLAAPDAGTAEKAARDLAHALQGATGLVRNAFWRPPLEEHPEEVGELLAFLWLNQPPAGLAALEERLSPTNIGNVLADARDRLAVSVSPLELATLARDPYGLTQFPSREGASPLGPDSSQGFASEDGEFRIVMVEALDSFGSYRASAEWLGEIRLRVKALTQSADWPKGVKIGYTGAPAFVSEIAGGMERDLRGSSLGTVLMITLLYSLVWRRWRPTVVLFGLLLTVLVVSLGAGGLILGTLNVVSFGFAAVLAGLAEDYAAVLYAESTSAPHLSRAEILRRVWPGVAWSAFTTCAAFASLTLCGLPGMSQLGILVSVGLALAVLVFMRWFLPLAMGAEVLVARHSERELASRPKGWPWVWHLTAATVIGAAIIVWQRPPSFARDTKTLEPSFSTAREALNQVEQRLGLLSPPLWLVVSGTNDLQMSQRLAAAQARLAPGLTNGLFSQVEFPTGLWPDPLRQDANFPAWSRLAARRRELDDAALAAGFSGEALQLTDAILTAWKPGPASPAIFYPTGAAARWTLERLTDRRPGNSAALGRIFPRADAAQTLSALRGPRLAPGTWICSWDLLGGSIWDRVSSRVPFVLGLMGVVLMGSLGFAFRRWREVLLSVLTLMVSFLILQTLMSLTGRSWNLMSLMALPLIVGTGVDYPIHIQLALRRESGDLREVRRVIVRALFLAGATTVAGFGSLAWANNAGLSSLALVCVAGIATVLILSTVVLPYWWLSFEGRGPTGASSPGPGSPAGPSAFYRAGLWRVCLAVARRMPRRWLKTVGEAAAAAYVRFRPDRRSIVEENLLVVCGGDRNEARITANRLFRQFAAKLIDLWRWEAGASIEEFDARWSGGEILEAARERGRGLLLITAHLGNWELGAPLLARQGFSLLVVTQAEPGADFTDLRRHARARHGIDTLVVGQDTFAFIEILRRLQNGETVALLVDRPPVSGALTVELFGRTFQASRAPVELARASGCALVGVAVVREGDGYVAGVLAEFPYDQKALSDAKARRTLTQQIVRAFEPVIQKHPDQWFHFVPIWADRRVETPP